MHDLFCFFLSISHSIVIYGMRMFFLQNNKKGSTLEKQKLNKIRWPWVDNAICVCVLVVTSRICYELESFRQHIIVAYTTAGDTSIMIILYQHNW